MQQELTPLERQRLAFALLRDQARSSHQEGDGLRVNHLCEIGYQEIQRLFAENKFQLSIEEVQWMFVFALYWLVDSYPLHTVAATLKLFGTKTNCDERAFNLITCHHFLIAEPLSNQQQAFEKLNRIDARCFGSEPTIEMLESATHLIELAWFRSASDDLWMQLVDKWSNVGPKWLASSLQGTKNRLVVQTRLTSPDSLHPVLTPRDLEAVRNVDPLAELWLLHLQGDANGVHQRVKDASATMRIGAHQWRLYADFWHINSMRAQDNGADNQGVWLARRRKLTTDYPLLVFQDRRELQIVEASQELYRRRTEEGASTRWKILQLAALHELAALRLWDYGMWREATRAQADTFLDAAQWSNPDVGLTVHGLVLGLRAGTIQSPEKDLITAAAIRLLEFAPSTICNTLAEGVLNAYPSHQHQAVELLESIADLLPVEKWLQLANWTVEYAQRTRTNRLLGWRMIPLKFWNKILPELSATSSVWAILQPEMLIVSQNSVLWDIGEDLLLTWLACAPLPYASIIAESMKQVPINESSASYIRSKLLIDAEARRGDDFKQWTQSMPPNAISLSEKLLLAKHLKDVTLVGLMNEVRAQVISTLRASLTQAAPEADTTTFNMGRLPESLYLIDKWSVEDIHILQALIDTINSPNVLQLWVYQLLQAVQWLTHVGPKEYAELVRPFLHSWMEQPPKGRSTNAPLHAFSTMRIMDGISGDILRVLGWIAFQVHTKLSANTESELHVWVRWVVKRSDVKAMPLAIHSCLILMPQSDPTERLVLSSMLNAIVLTLRLRAHDQQDTSQYVANALYYLAGNFAKKTQDLLDWSSEDGNELLYTLLKLLEDWYPQLMVASDPMVRSGAAQVLYNLSLWHELSPVFNHALDKFRGDSRAQVRFAAVGGWYSRVK